MKKILLIPTALAVTSMPLISLCGCNNPDKPDPKIEPTGISIDQTSLDLKIGETVTLKATVEPVEASQEVVWSTSNEAIATIDNNGLVKAIAKGKATITVKPKGYDIPAVCVVNAVEPEHDYSKDYLTFTALEDGELYFDIFDTKASSELGADVNLYYSINEGGWNEIEPNYISGGSRVHDPIEYEKGETIRLKGENSYWSYIYGESDEYYLYSTLHFSGLGNISGNVMSLLYGDNFFDKQDLRQVNGCFVRLFYALDKFSTGDDFPQLANAKNLILPANTLTDGCYKEMFSRCRKLTTMPNLPAKTLAPMCYEYMFDVCTSLNVDKDYFLNNFFNDEDVVFAYDWAYGMFSGLDIRELFTLPDSSHYILKPYCFSGLNSYINVDSAPADYLPWTTLAEGCYYSMFSDCENLVQPPQLPASVLTKNCYSYMFYWCDSLNANDSSVGGHSFFECPATIPDGATKGMFLYTPSLWYPGDAEPGVTYYWH